MILEKYEYRYALIPHKEARKMGLGWRKADANGMVMMNLSELKQLPGDGTVEERVATIGGHLLDPDEAYYYRHTNNFSFVQHTNSEPQETPQGQVPDIPQTDETEEIDPGFTQGGTQTEFPAEGEQSVTSPESIPQDTSTETDTVGSGVETLSVENETENKHFKSKKNE